MKLVSIEAHGFKSFADKIEIKRKPEQVNLEDKYEN